MISNLSSTNGNLPSGRPNIVLITIDCWRGDHLGIIDDTRVKTPHLDRLASEGTLFSNASTCGGWTKIAMTTLFSSTYASMYGFAQGKLSAERPMLAEALQQQGYETAGFTTNMVCSDTSGFDRGFSTFKNLKPDLTPRGIERLRKVRGYGRFGHRKTFHAISSLFGIRLMPIYPSITADALVDEALVWLAQPQPQSYFLWLHLMDIHWPYRSSGRPHTSREVSGAWQDRASWKNIREHRGRGDPGQARSQRWKDLYAEETQTLDRALGRLFDGLRQRKDWPETAVVVTGDHGEEFHEHGTWAHSWNQLHHEGIHVPLILRLPHVTNKQRIDQPVSHIDLAPTILALAKIPPPEKMMGQSLLPLIHDDENRDQRPIYTEMFGHRDSYRYRLAIQADGYKYIYDGDQGQCQLFDLHADPEEETSLYATNQDLARTFDRLRLAHIGKGVLDIFKNNVLLTETDIPYDIGEDPTVVERLQALGYLE